MFFNVTRNPKYYLNSNDSEHGRSRRTHILEPQFCYNFSLNFELESDRKFNKFLNETFLETDFILNYHDCYCCKIYDVDDKSCATITYSISNFWKFDVSPKFIIEVITSTWSEKISSLFLSKFVKAVKDFASTSLKL